MIIIIVAVFSAKIINLNLQFLLQFLSFITLSHRRSCERGSKETKSWRFVNWINQFLRLCPKQDYPVLNTLKWLLYLSVHEEEEDGAHGQIDEVGVAFLGVQC
jgi:hypothetical protein